VVFAHVLVHDEVHLALPWPGELHTSEQLGSQKRAKHMLPLRTQLNVANSISCGERRDA
jgi:hypothetical protein